MNRRSSAVSFVLECVTATLCYWILAPETTDLKACIHSSYSCRCPLGDLQPQHSPLFMSIRNWLLALFPGAS